jgi:hypothetical protein
MFVQPRLAKIHGKRGQLKGEAAPFKSIRLSPDAKAVTIEIPGLAPVDETRTATVTVKIPPHGRQWLLFTSKI